MNSKVQFISRALYLLTYVLVEMTCNDCYKYCCVDFAVYNTIYTQYVILSNYATGVMKLFTCEIIFFKVILHY